MKKLILSISLCLLLAGQALAADVVVTWVTEDKAVTNAASATNFVLGLGVTEVKPSLSARSHTFTNIAPGTYSIWIATVDGAGKELAPNITASVVVPPAATAPIPVTIGGAVQ